MFLSLIVAMGVLAVPAHQPAAMPTQIAQDVTKHLMSLPYYGVYDLTTLAVDQNDVVTLVGVVDSGGDKTLAGLKARGVGTVLTVNNDREVATKSSESK